jgi:O-succinylbenzoic acid--CoA ligase
VPRQLTAIDLSALPLDDALEHLRAALDGSGDALLPTASDPAAARAREELAVGTPLRDGEDDPDDPTALVAATSGSTGAPKGALLQASALRASARATHDRLGGSGTWLLALPTHHVAGVQVLLRSLHAGTRPGVLDLRSGFVLDAFATEATGLVERSERAYTALVPTQLVRILADGGPALRALAAFHAVLLGGAAAAPALLEDARRAGINVVTTYGMSETCGGCVYDGLPLDGVQVQVADRIRLGGPVVARGYRSVPGAAQFQDSAQFQEYAGTRWFATNDLGELKDGRLTVLGRADDVIITGGVKVSPQAVEAVLAEVPGVRECLVVGVPDDEWGHRVVAVLVASPSPDLETLQHNVSTRLGAVAAPRSVVHVEALPTSALGKPDRRAAAALALAALSR